VDAVTTTRPAAPQRPAPRRVREEPTGTAVDLTDRGRLLAGENGDTRDVAEALHWAKVYADLFAYKEELGAVTENKAASMSLAARAELAGDIMRLRREAQRLDLRLQFWRRQSAVLLARAETAQGVRTVDAHST
jgi:hypothetical protein